MSLSALTDGPLGELVAGLCSALLRSSLTGILLIGALWLVCRALRRLPPGLVATLWWAASLKLLLGLVWWAPLGELAVLPTQLGDIAVFAAAQRHGSSPPAAARTTSGRTASLHPDSLHPAASFPVSTQRVSTQRVSTQRVPTRPETRSGVPAPRVGQRVAIDARGDGRVASATAAPWTPGASMVAAPLLVGLWALGLMTAAAIGLARHRRLRRLLAAAALADDAPLVATAERVAVRLGVRMPRMLVSDEVPAPLVAGILRPTLLLPRCSLGALEASELELLLTHELVHLRRHDLWLGLVPALARALYFFHPLAALAAREYLLAREAACDAEVLHRVAAPPRLYGRLLLRWGVVRTSLAPAAPAAARSYGQLKRRLLMLDEAMHHRRSRRVLAAVVTLPMIAALLPLRLVAAPAAAPPAGDVAAATATPAASARGTSSPAVSVAVIETSATGSGPGTATSVSSAVTAEPTSASAFGATTATAVATGSTASNSTTTTAASSRSTQGGSSTSSSSTTTSSSSSTYLTADGTGDGYAVFQGEGSSSWFDMTLDDGVRHELRGSEKGPAFWVRRDGQLWVIRDPAIVAAAQEVVAPIQELGQQQGELGGRQGELGGQQGELGAQQGRLGAEQGKLGAEQGKLGAEQGRLGSRLGRLADERRRLERELERAAEGDRSAARQRLDRIDAESAGLEAQMRELDARQSALGEQQRALGEQQSALGRQQSELGKRQSVLGEQQGKLGKQQSELAAKARAELRRLADRAIAEGKAEKQR